MKWLLSFVAIWCAPLFVYAYTSPGTPTGFVNDFSGLLQAEERTSLEATLSTFEKETGNEITVVTIESLGDETVETYAVKLFEEWKIGKEKYDNGILFLIVPTERQMRLEVGYGLEGALPDALTSQIMRTITTPDFQKGDYAGGIARTVDALMSATRGEYQVTEQKESRGFPLEFFFFLFFILPTWLGSILGRSKSWWAGGVIGGIAGIILSVVFGFFYIGIASLVVLIPLGLFFDYIVSRSYSKALASGLHAPWWTGGGKGGMGGGFGGFGGGGSGGGGSSGRW